MQVPVRHVIVVLFTNYLIRVQTTVESPLETQPSYTHTYYSPQVYQIVLSVNVLLMIWDREGVI